MCVGACVGCVGACVGVCVGACVWDVCWGVCWGVRALGERKYHSPLYYPDTLVNLDT